MIEKAKLEDLESILELQKLSFGAEAAFCGNDIPPLTQTLEEIKIEFNSNIIIKFVSDGQIIGSARAYKKDDVCYIGRVIVNPLYQNKGIGSSLMSEIENCFSECKKYSLFTGKHNTKNINFYKKLGYSITDEKEVNNKLTFVFLEKSQYI